MRFPRRQPRLVFRSQSVPPSNGSGPFLPPGVELWTPEHAHRRPVADLAIFHGPIGEYALLCADYSEADPVAVLVHALIQFATAVGGTPYCFAGHRKQPAVIHGLFVGASSQAGKGTAQHASQDLAIRIDPGFESRIRSGFGSGEALIAELAAEADIDQRILVMEDEFAGFLSKCKRDTSVLAPTLRSAWDGSPLENRTRSAGRLVAQKHHVGVIGHITADQLRDKMSSGDIYGGTANRLLHIWCERGELHPRGGNIPEELLAKYSQILRKHLSASRRFGRIERTPEAEDLWDSLYRRLANDTPPGLLGHVVARGRPQCLRLSLVYALADGQGTIDADHVAAASALWDYSRATAAIVYGEGTGDIKADRLLAALRDAGPDGLDSTAGHQLFGNRPGVFARVRGLLEAQGLAVTVALPSKGRPRLLTYAVPALNSQIHQIRSIDQTDQEEQGSNP